MEFFTFLAFSLYVGILGSIGLLAHKTSRSDTDYLLGGRKTNYFITAISAHASDMSSWLFMGFPAMIFAHGGQQYWVAIGLFCGMFLSWQYIAPRLRTLTEEYQALTLSSYFAQRFNDKNGSIRIVTALMSLVFFTFYITSNLRGMGIISEMVFGIDYTIALSISVAVVIIYTFIGGYTAVAYSDFFQGMFLMTMIVLVPLYALKSISFTQIFHQANLHNISLALFPSFSFTSIVEVLSISLGWGLGYFGQPHILSKFMGIRRVNEIRKAQAIGMSWQFITLLAATAVGLIGMAFFPHGLANNELIFITMVKELFHPFFGSFILCSILAAAISTIDSQVLVFASVLSKDLFQGYLMPQASSSAVMKASRFGVLFICLLSYGVACYEVRSIFTLVKYAWSGLGASFGPLLLCSLHTQKITHSGALAGIIVGGSVAALWPITGLAGATYPIIPGFIASLIAIWGISLVSGKNLTN